MSILDRFKKSKGNDNKKEEKKTILPNTNKYNNMTLYAPARGRTAKEFYIRTLDENNNPIVNETIEVKVNNEIKKYQTDKNGLISIPIDLKPGFYPVEVFFPNGEYPPSIESSIRRATPRKLKAIAKRLKQKKKPDEKNVYLYTPNMKMYRNSETQYYAKLSDYKFNPVKGEEVKFTFNNETHTAITDDEGFAKVDVKLYSGRYPVEIEYEGSEKYHAKTKEAVLKVETRDIDKKLMIDVDHLTMEFKVTNDKIDTLKEFIIRTIKRNKEKKEKIRILDDISFKVYEGDKLGILGFNGAGKSTLLKVLSGIYEPTAGSISIYGKIAPLLELGAGFDNNYTGKNNIYLNGAFLSMDEKFIDEKYDEIVAFSELGEFINYPVKNYSSGMKAKLGFSIATMVEPDILIVDEILSVGDIKFKKKSSEKINSMMKDGATVLLVSHSISQIKKICNKCIWLEDGKIVARGDVDEVCDAYLSSANGISKRRK